jgi:uncharacterized protein (TIGR03905 family)
MANIMYKTHGTCSQFIELDVADDDTITRVHFIGGCDGNLQGICKLIVGMKLDDVKNKLDGIRCGGKPTSCPDQLCRAIEQLQAKKLYESDK